MTNEMKLLTALCDALGFDVEKVCVNQDMMGKPNNSPVGMGAFGFNFLLSADCIEPIYEYKLTKRRGDGQAYEVTNKEEFAASPHLMAIVAPNKKASQICKGMVDNMKTAMRHENINTDSLTKKEDMVTLPVQGEVWGAIVKYVLAHSNDIEAGINDYGDLKSILDYFNRNCK